MKIVEEDDDGSSATMTLRSYSYTPRETDGEIMVILPPVMVGVACAVAVVAILLVQRGRRSPEEPESATSQGEPSGVVEEETDWSR